MIREYTSEDFEATLSLYVDTFIKPPFEYDWMTLEKMAPYIQDLINTPRFKGYLYFEKDRLVGVCIGTLCDYFLACGFDIKEVFIEYEYQSKGLGTRFFQLLEHELIASGVKFINLATQSNIPAYNFYIKNGFSISEDTVYMCKFF